MSWFDTLQKGSFRGVPFLWEDADGELGRRQAVHEYPGRDVPYVEDMGRRTRRFTNEMVSAGPDYMAERDRMAAALEQPGAGPLSHPTRGEIMVAVIEARGPRESTRAGGLARFSVSFIESGERLEPRAATDSAGQVAEAVETARTALSAQTVENLILDAFPGWVADDAAAQVSDMARQYARLIRRLPGIAAQTDVAIAVQDLSDATATLVRAPIDLAQSLDEIWEGIKDAVDAPGEAVSALESYFDYAGTGDDVPQTTPARLRQQANRDALAYQFSIGALVTACDMAAAADYDSQQAADDMRDALCLAIDDASLTADDALFDALTGLYTALVGNLGDRPGLPELVTVTLVQDIPALVLAQQLYGDAARAADIVSRNAVEHPGFVPAGRALEVLNV
jgi:prophage DNA circulation protein